MFQKHVSKWLSAYCHDELTEGRAVQVRLHLLRCPGCQREYELIQRGIKLAESLQPMSAPDSLWTSVIEKKQLPEKRWEFTPRWKYALVAMATIVLLIFMWGRWNQNQKINKITPTNSSLSWEVANVTGAPRIGESEIKERGNLAVGEWLETDNASKAQIKVAEIGFVNVDPNSRLQLVQTKETEHRIALTKGKMSAVILAPPRLFMVDTPSATAVDLGCAYTLEVDEAGGSLLHVTSGWVSFVRDGQESFIPAGAMCATRKGFGLGTPYLASSSDAFKSALNLLDFGNAVSSQSTITTILTEARGEDALTLWHLLGRQYNEETQGIRGLIYDHLKKLSPPPNGVTRTGIINGDRQMLKLWWEAKIG